MVNKNVSVFSLKYLPALLFISLIFLAIACKNEIGTAPEISDALDNSSSSLSSAASSSAASSTSTSTASSTSSSATSSSASSATSSSPSGTGIGVFSDVYGTNYFSLTTGNATTPLTTAVSVGSGNGHTSGTTTSIQINLPRYNSGGSSSWHEVRIEGRINIVGNELTGTSVVSFWLKPDADSALQIVLQTSPTTGGSFNAKTYFGSGGLPAINVVAGVWTNISFVISGTQIGQYFRRLDLQNVGGNDWANAICDELVVFPSGASSSSASSSSAASSASSSSVASSSSSVASSSSSSSTNVSPNSYLTGKISNAVYIGRWDNSGTVDKGYWATAAVKVNFKGTTSVKIEYNVTFNSKAFAYSINGAPVTLVLNAQIAGSGIVQVPIANSLDPTKEYTLTIYNGPAAARDLDDYAEIQIRNLILDPGGITLAPTHLKPYVLEFIGDSITAGYQNQNVAYDNYSYRIGQMLNTETVNISQSGITFANMATKYFAQPAGFNINAYHPDLIFINLGTNPSAPTQQDIINYFTALRAKHPAAYIVMISLLNNPTDRLKTEIQGAIQVLNDPKMLFRSGVGIVNNATSDYLDFNHPSELGNQKIADHFAPIIAGLLGITYP